MSTADWSDTIHDSAGRSRVAYAVALTWFVGRQLTWCLGRSVDAVLFWAERARQRRQLAELDEYMLRDLGLTRADVDSEVRKSFWQR